LHSLPDDHWRKEKVQQRSAGDEFLEHGSGPLCRSVIWENLPMILANQLRELQRQARLPLQAHPSLCVESRMLRRSIVVRARRNW
jgi:hypothetical protein